MPVIEFPDGTQVDLGDNPSAEMKSLAAAKFDRVTSEIQQRGPTTSTTTTPLSPPPLFRDLAVRAGASPRGALAAEQSVQRFIPPVTEPSDLPRQGGAMAAGYAAARLPLPWWARLPIAGAAEILGGVGGEAAQMAGETIARVPPREPPLERLGSAAKTSAAGAVLGLPFTAMVRPRTIAPEPGPVTPTYGTDYLPRTTPEVGASVARQRAALEAEATKRMQGAVTAERQYAPQLNRQLTSLEAMPATEVPMPGGGGRIMVRGAPGPTTTRSSTDIARFDETGAEVSGRQTTANQTVATTPKVRTLRRDAETLIQPRESPVEGEPSTPIVRETRATTSTTTKQPGTLSPTPKITQADVPSTVQDFRNRARQAVAAHNDFAARFPPEQSASATVQQLAKDPELVDHLLTNATPAEAKAIVDAMDTLREFSMGRRQAAAESVVTETLGHQLARIERSGMLHGPLMTPVRRLVRAVELGAAASQHPVGRAILTISGTLGRLAAQAAAGSFRDTR